MEHYIFQRQHGAARLIENPADNNSIMGRVEMSQQATRNSPAPSQTRHPHQTVEKLAVEPLENVFQIVNHALWPGDEFASPDLAHQMSLATHIAAIEIQPVTMGVQTRHWLTVKLPQQNIRQCLHHRRRRGRQKVRNPYA